MTIESILEEFDQFCILNKDGDCKYWKPESFGYSPDDKEAPLDKFFPKLIKDFFTQKLTEYRNSVIEECIGAVPESAHALTGVNLQHSKEELYCCIECYEDKFLNMCGAQTIYNLNNLKV